MQNFLKSAFSLLHQSFLQALLIGKNIHNVLKKMDFPRLSKQQKNQNHIWFRYKTGIQATGCWQAKA